jgi:hydrogenase-4 component B
MAPADTFNAALAAYLAGAAASAVAHRHASWARWLSFSLASAGALLEGFAATLGLLSGADTRWVLPSGLPYLPYSLRLDALSCYFHLALALLALTASVYSLGYLRHSQGAGFLGCFYNLLLLSLAVVFTAANAFFFLIAWEVMALAAYGLVSYDHQNENTRGAGILFFIMSHAGTGCLILGFLLLFRATGGYEFAAFHAIGGRLSPLEKNAAFLLFFLGFGVKAGIIPLHIWLPAAHPVAPSNVSALMSGIMIKTGIYGLARVLFDFLTPAPRWWGALVLAVGVVSGLLGVLYALMEHDLKRLLAYHSIENIGIILLGLGGAVMFQASGHPSLAAIALIAGLYHTLNHAIFKALLFLGAGAVLDSTGTRNMEELGGLIRRMPKTALYFLVGSVAISGLPPLNGFVSEWLTYQALLAGFGTTQSLVRMAFPIAGSLLALTAALAAACFVKAFGITFLALPRSEAAGKAHEASFTMRAGMFTLAAACVILGLGATWFLPVFDPITGALLGSAVSEQLRAPGGFVLVAGSARAGAVSPMGIAGLLVALLLVPAFLYLLWARRSSRTFGPVWDCGLQRVTAANEYTATAFSKPIRMIFAALYRPTREIEADYEVSPYFPKGIRFESEIEPAFEKHLYDPLRDWILALAARFRAIQAGSIHAYLAYIFVTLILLLIFGARP